jgi:hypothetical protein
MDQGCPGHPTPSIALSPEPLDSPHSPQGQACHPRKSKYDKSTTEYKLEIQETGLTLQRKTRTDLETLGDDAEAVEPLARVDANAEASDDAADDGANAKAVQLDGTLESLKDSKAL